MSLKNFWNRDNAKWSHPEFGATYESVTELSGFDTICYNPETSLAERQKWVNQFLEAYAVEYTEEQKARIKTIYVPGCEEEPDAPLVKVNIAYPKEIKKKNNVIINFGAGGLAMCITEPNFVALSDRYNCIGIEFYYRTTAEGAKYPLAVNDCHAVYKYLVEHAEELKINPKRIVFMGDSSGGHMALALCHRLKKYDYPKVRGCIVFVPALDDRNIYPSSKIVSSAWASNQNDLMAKYWLGECGNTAFVTPEMFPNHATVEDCIGLPPTAIHAFANDVYSDPCMQYASKLNEAGVYVGMHMWAGSNHDALYTAHMMYRDDPEYPYTNAFIRVVDQEIADFFQYDLTRPWAVTEAAE